MFRKIVAIAVAVAGLAVSACGGRFASGGAGAAGGSTMMLPPIDSDLIMEATMPKDSIGEELPGEGLGQVYSGHWKALVGGFTQKTYSQTLGFPPGTKITIHNLSKSVTHTLDVVKVDYGPPAGFPKNPKLSVPAHGHALLELGYASGPIKPGKTVTVTLAKAGKYLVGCAFHYGEGMRTVIVVENGATPGPQATAPRGKPTPTPTPHSRSSYSPDGT
jgi:plastocyanin